MKKGFKIGLYIVLAIIIVNIISFIYSVVIAEKHNYDIIHNPTKTYNYLFKKKFENKLQFDYAIGNDNEQIYVFKFENDYDLIIWSINGFSKIDLSEVKLINIEDFDKIGFNSTNISGFKCFQIISKGDLLKANSLNIYINNEVDIRNHFDENNFSYLNIVSKGIALGDLHEYKIKIESNENIHFNFALIKSRSEFQFVILAPRGNHNMEDDLLLKVLKRRNRK